MISRVQNEVKGKEIRETDSRGGVSPLRTVTETKMSFSEAMLCCHSMTALPVIFHCLRRQPNREKPCTKCWVEVKMGREKKIRSALFLLHQKGLLVRLRERLAVLAFRNRCGL